MLCPAVAAATVAAAGTEILALTVRKEALHRLGRCSFLMAHGAVALEPWRWSLLLSSRDLASE